MHGSDGSEGFAVGAFTKTPPRKQVVWLASEPPSTLHQRRSKMLLAHGGSIIDVVRSMKAGNLPIAAEARKWHKYNEQRGNHIRTALTRG